VERPNDLIVFTGWTPLNTLGRRIQNGEKRVRIYDRWYDVRCQVRSIDGLSAHADSQELLKFLGPTLRKETQFYIVHGEADQADVFAERLIQNGAGRATVRRWRRRLSLMPSAPGRKLCRREERSNGRVIFRLTSGRRGVSRAMRWNESPQNGRRRGL